MRVEVNTFKIVCDGCGETFRNHNDFSCYINNPKEIEHDADDSLWLITQDGHHYCDRCRSLNEYDEWECRDGKVYSWDGVPINVGLVKE